MLCFSADDTTSTVVSFVSVLENIDTLAVPELLDRLVMRGSVTGNARSPGLNESIQAHFPSLKIKP